MTLEITTIPCLSDNYAYLATCHETGVTALIDAPEAAPIKAELARQGKTLSMILITHHHDDHIQGVDALRGEARVYGAKADQHRLPDLDVALEEGDVFKIGSYPVNVITAYGHTIGHIVFHVPKAKAAFTADTLMAMGCGRIFEGTPSQTWAGLSKLAALPEETHLYSGHEYTQANAKFAASIDTQNPLLAKRMSEIDAARAQSLPTVPSLLSLERQTNPFLRVMDDDFKKALGMPKASDEEAFIETRKRKDAF